MISLWTSEWNYRAGTKRLSLSLINLANGQGLWIRHTFISDKKKAQGQTSRTPGEVIHLKVIFTETREEMERKREEFNLTRSEGWWMEQQTETSIKNKWKYLISPFTDWIYIAGVCCLVTSHCPAHFQMLISLETINKSMAVGFQAWLFPGEKAAAWSSWVGTLVCSEEMDLNRNVTAILKHFSRVVQGRRFVRGLTI